MFHSESCWTGCHSVVSYDETRDRDALSIDTVARLISDTRSRDRWTLTLRRTSSSIYVLRLIRRLYKISNYDDLSLRNRFVEPLKTSSKETYTVKSIEEISVIREVLDSSIERKWKAEWRESREWKVTNVRGHGTVIFANIKLCCVKRTKFFMKYTLSVLRDDRHTGVL